MIDSARLWRGWLWLLNRNLLYILGIVAVWTFWDYVGGVLPNELGVIYLAYTTLGSTIFPATLTIRLIGPEKADLSVALGIALSRFWGLLGLVIISTIVLLIGFILLIVPGLVLATFLSLAMCILLAEGRPLMEAIRDSFSRIRPVFWQVFGMLVIIAVFSVGAFMLLQLFLTMLIGQGAVNGPFLRALLNNLMTSLFVVWTVALYFEIQHIRTEP